jgi:hypothetical protein
LTVSRGGTGLSTLAYGQVLIGNNTNPIVQTSNLIWDISNNNLGIGKNPASKLDVNGTVSATLFSGSGASLTGLTEGQIPELSQSRISDLDFTMNSINANLSLLRSGLGIENLDASKLSGTIDNECIVVTSSEIPDLDTDKITSGTINNERITLTAEKIPDLDANKITSGTINNDRITLTVDNIPDLDASKITSGL